MTIETLWRQIDARLSVMPDVARNKWNIGRPIEDEGREHAIVSCLSREAETLGVPKAWAAEFFVAQIDAAKHYQYVLFAQWKRDNVGLFQNVPALDEVTRPYIDKITAKMLFELATAWPTLRNPNNQKRVASVMLQLGRDSSYQEALSIATKPLTDLSSFNKTLDSI